MIRTLEHLLKLPEMPAIVVVDNASTDASSVIVAQRFPQVTLISLERNIGAAVRNIGVRRIRTPYVAFADDDSWWACGSLGLAVRLLDEHPRIAALSARILLGPEQREDPVCRSMASGPLPSEGLPGPALLGFIACAVVFRRQAYLDAGGYEEKFFVGGEEELLTLDLVSAGWSVVYAPQMVVHHYPSPQRDNVGRQKIVIRNALWVAWLRHSQRAMGWHGCVIRNALWVAWLRLPLPAALKQTWRIIRSAPNRQVMKAAIMYALRELPWVYLERKVMPPGVEALYHRLRT